MMWNYERFCKDAEAILKAVPVEKKEDVKASQLTREQ